MKKSLSKGKKKWTGFSKVLTCTGLVLAGTLSARDSAEALTIRSSSIKTESEEANTEASAVVVAQDNAYTEAASTGKTDAESSPAGEQSGETDVKASPAGEQSGETDAGASSTGAQSEGFPAETFAAESSEADTAADSADSEDIAATDDAILTLPEELALQIARLDGLVTEEETETETETETELETESEAIDENEQAFREFLKTVRLGEDFQIPMAMPDELGTLPGPVTYSCGTLSIGRAERVHPWEQAKTMEELEALVQEAINGYEGTWSVYVKNLNTDESFVINDQPMKSASVMKLFIMGTVYTAFEEGELERTDEIMSLMNAMISYSDNASSNQLLYILGNSSYADGIAKVNAFIQSHGYSEMTVEYNGFSNSATNSGNGINQVAAKDVGQLLEDIYRRTWMSRAVSNEMEEMLLAQNTRYKIPAGLPDGVLCANKTGEMSDTQNDAAIIYSDACDYILVVLSNGWSSTDTAITRISNLSSLVYEYLN